MFHENTFIPIQYSILMFFMEKVCQIMSNQSIKFAHFPIILLLEHYFETDKKIIIFI
jgi:hypothetical protein